MIIEILSLVDARADRALLLIIGFSGYENFVSKISIGDHEDRPAWMGKVGFSDLKIKLIGAHRRDLGRRAPQGVHRRRRVRRGSSSSWKVGIHMTFVVSGVLFAITDRITESKPAGTSILSACPAPNLTCTLCCKVLDITAHSAYLLP